MGGSFGCGHPHWVTSVDRRLAHSTGHGTARDRWAASDPRAVVVLVELRDPIGRRGQQHPGQGIGPGRGQVDPYADHVGAGEQSDRGRLAVGGSSEH